MQNVNYRVLWLSGLFLVGMLLVSACSSPFLGKDNDAVWQADSLQNWTAVPNDPVESSWLYSVAWGNTAAGGTFVAVGMGGTIAYSADGESWTLLEEPEGDEIPTPDITTKKPFPARYFPNDLNGVTWGNGKFVVVGRGVDGSVSPTLQLNVGKAAYSTDGTVWEKTNLISSNVFQDVAWGDYGTNNGSFVRVGRLGEINCSYYPPDMGGQVVWVHNQITSLKHSSGSYITLNSVAWGKDRFVAAGEGGKMAYSTDGGRNWKPVTDSSFGSGVINSVAWGSGKFVAAGEGGKMGYSTDGVVWTPVIDSTFGSGVINSVAWGSGKFVAAGESGKMAYSANGVVWTPVMNSAFDGEIIYDIAWGNNRWVAVGSAGTIAYCDVP